jgi:hypothetical protein
MALKYLYVPSGYKGGGSSGTAYGVLPNVSNADLAFVRGSLATRINADGLIESMATNVPRLDYTDGSCPTLLTEPASTNLVEYSEDFTQWTVSGAPAVSVTNNSLTGQNNAYIIEDDNSSGYERVEQNITTIESTYTLSVFIKKKSSPVSSYSGIQFNAANKYIIFDSYNGTYNTVTGNDYTNISVDDYGSYWRLKATAPMLAGTNRVGIWGAISLNGTSISTSATGSETFFGCSVEQLEYATSYISTSGATVTRSADTGVISGDLSSYINSSEGVLEIKAKALFNGGSDVRVSLSDGTTNNRVSLVYGTGANSMTLIMKANSQDVFDGGTSSFKNLTGSIPQTDMTTFKIKWKSGDIQVKVNNTTIALSETDSFSNLSLDQVSLDGGSGSNLFEGNVQYIKVYDSATDF